MSSSFATIAKELSSHPGTAMPILSPDDLPMYAYEDPESRQWSITTQPEAVAVKYPGILTYPCELLVTGQDTPAFKKRKAELYRMSQKNRKLKYKEADFERLKTLACGVVGMNHVVWTDDEHDAPYLLNMSDENVITFLGTYAPAAEQLDAFLADRANFFVSD